MHVCNKSSGLNVTAVAFLVFPTRTNNFNVESLRGQAIAKQLKDAVSEVQKDIGARIFNLCLRYLWPQIENSVPCRLKFSKIHEFSDIFISQ